MHLWESVAIAGLSLLVACGEQTSDQPGDEFGGTGEQSDESSSASAESGEDAAEAAGCPGSLPEPDDVIDSPDTAMYQQMLEGAMTSAGTSAKIQVIDSTLSGTHVAQFCPLLMMENGWLHETANPCFEVPSGGLTQADFAAYVALLPHVEPVVGLDVVQAAAESCHEGIFEPYEPCTNLWGMKHSMALYRSRQVDGQGYIDSVVIDLVTGDVTACDTEVVAPDGG